MCMKRKNINLFVIFVGAICLVAGIVILVLNNNHNNNFTSKYKNTVSEKKIINTQIDFNSIFEIDTDASNYMNIKDPTNIIMTNDRIYYSFSPLLCDYESNDNFCNNIDEYIKTCEESQKKVCSENPEYSKTEFCTTFSCQKEYSSQCEKSEDVSSLCNVYMNKVNDNNINSKEEIMKKRYLISQKFDGSDFRELEVYDLSSDVVSFDFANKNYIYFNHYSYEKGLELKRIDLENLKVEEVKKDVQIAPYPLSHDDSITLIGGSNYDYNLTTYNANDMTEKSRISTYSELNDLRIVIDKDSNDLYNYTSKQQSNNKIVIYKNGKQLFDVDIDYYMIYDMFITKKYIYFIYESKNDNKNYLAKIDKNTGKIINDKINLEVDDFINFNYLVTNSSNTPYFLVENNVYSMIYYFDEESEKFIPIEKNEMSTIDNAITYHNWIIYENYNNNINCYLEHQDDLSICEQQQNDSDNGIMLYNVDTKERKVIKNAYYKYINQGRLYILEKNDSYTTSNDEIMLSYYDID